MSTPPSHRRAARLWAWRARPSRPLAYLAIAIACASTVAWTASKLDLSAAPPFDAGVEDPTPEPPVER